MKIVILGCGRIGATIAMQLSHTHRVSVVDWNAAAFDRLGFDFAGVTVQGNGIDVEVLRAAGVESADLFIAVTDGDNRNLVSAQAARLLGVPRVIARVYDAERSHIYANMGITTVSPTVGGAKRLYDMVTGSRQEG